MDFIRVNEHITLSEITINDINSFVEFLNEKEIYENTLSIPFPYTLDDAKWFVNFIAEQKKKNEEVYDWAIRNNNNKLIGVIGFHGRIDGHKSEIGYWLAKKYWGNGIMTEALNKVCEIAFNDLKLKRITATIFEHNKASAKVAEKCGFQLEAEVLKNYYKKDGKIFNGKLYAKTI